MRGFIHPKKKIQIGLLILLLAASFLLLFNNKFRASVILPLIIYKNMSGTIVSEVDKMPISGADVSFIYNGVLQNGAENFYRSTTDSQGHYSLKIPSTIKQGILTFEKDGFYDLEGIADVPPIQPTLRTINLTMKPGFGKETFISKNLKNGFNQLSLPFTPYGQTLEEVFTDLDIEGASIPPEFTQGKDVLNTQLAYKLGDCAAAGATVLQQPAGAKIIPQTGQGGNEVCPAFEPTYLYPDLPNGWKYSDDRQNLDGDVDLVYSGTSGNATGTCSLTTNPSCTFSNLSTSGSGWTYNYISIFENNPNLKFYFQNFQGIPELYDPQSQWGFKYFPKEIKGATGYYIQNNAQDYQITIKGEINDEDFNFPMGEPLGNPFLEDFPLVNLKVLDQQSTYSFQEALDKNYIANIANVRTGVAPPTTNPDKIDFSKQSYILKPGDTILLQSFKAGLKLLFPYKDINSALEIPSELQAQDVIWADSVDPQNLSDSDMVKRDRIVVSLLKSAFQNYSYQALPPSSEDDGSPDFQNDLVVFSSNGKIIQEENSVLQDASLNNLKPKNLFDTASAATSICKNEPNSQNVEFKFCLKDKSNDVDDPTINWDQSTKDFFLNHIDDIYTNIKMYYGPPLQSISPHPRTLEYDVVIADLGKNIGGITFPNINTIVLNSFYLIGTGKNEDTATGILTHETTHAFRDNLSLNMFSTGLTPLEEGSAELVTVLVSKNLGLQNNFPEDKTRRAIEAIGEYNQPSIATNETVVLFDTDGVYGRFYRIAPASFSQILSDHPDFFKVYNQKLATYGKKSFPFEYMMNTAKTVGVKKTSIGFSDQSFIDWYKKQWGSFLQITVNRPLGTQVYRRVVPWKHKGTPAVGETVIVANVIHPSGLSQFPNFRLDSILYRTTTTANGEKITKRIESKKDILINSNNNPNPANGYTYKYDLTDPSLTKEKYTFVNVVKINNGKFPSNVYTGCPDEHAGIYGVVAEAHNSTVNITPLKPNKLDPRSFDVRDGYFQTGDSTADKLYGLNAGTYLLEYTSSYDGKTRQYPITKLEGPYFQAIRTGRTTLPSSAQKTHNLLEKISSVFSLNKVNAVDENKLTITNIKTSVVNNNSIKVTFDTNREAINQISWGETTNYGQITDYSESARKDHEVIISSLIKGITYHFKIYTIDTSGEVDEASQLVTAEDFDSALAESAETGDQTFEVPEIIITYQNDYPTYNSNTISWKTDPNFVSGGGIEYGSDTNYGQYTPEQQGSGMNGYYYYSPLTGLSPSTTYHYRIKAYLDENHPIYSDDRTFTTQAAPPTPPPPMTQDPNLIYDMNVDYYHYTFKTSSATTPTVPNILAFMTYTWNGYTSKCLNQGGSAIRLSPTNSTNHSYYFVPNGYPDYTYCNDYPNVDVMSLGFRAENSQNRTYDTEAGTYQRPKYSFLGGFQIDGTIGTFTYWAWGGVTTLSYKTIDSGTWTSIDHQNSQDSQNWVQTITVDLELNKRYEYKVISNNNVIDYNTFYVNPPAGMTAQFVSSSDDQNLTLSASASDIANEDTPEIELSWPVTGDPTQIDGYNIYRAFGESEPQILASVDKNQLKYADRSIEANKNYSYIVKSHKNDKETEIGKAKGQLNSTSRAKNQGFFHKVANNLKDSFHKIKIWFQKTF